MTRKQTSDIPVYNHYLPYEGRKTIHNDGSVGIVKSTSKFFKDEYWIEWVKPTDDLLSQYRDRGGCSTPFSIVTLEELNKLLKETL